ncbi:MAG: AAA family ATPase [Gammaproteobacteria bacterium]|nr:AAA family ATPase [Gammaproteobacteria bacterium]
MAEDNAGFDFGAGDWPLDLQDPWAAKIEPPVWLLDGYIAEGYQTSLIGVAQSGKSSVALEWGLRLAEQGVKTAFLLSESSSGWLERFKAMADPEVHTADMIKIHTAPLGLVGDRDMLQRTKEQLLVEGVKLLVVDTLGKTKADAFDENNNTDVEAFCTELESFTAAGITTVLIAHTGHSAPKRMRGGSSWHPSLQCVWHAEPRGGGAFDLDPVRFKDFSPDVRTMVFEQETGMANSRGEELWGRGQDREHIAKASGSEDRARLDSLDRIVADNVRQATLRGASISLQEVQTIIKDAVGTEHMVAQDSSRKTLAELTVKMSPQAVGMRMKKLGYVNYEDADRKTWYRHASAT